MDPAPMPAIAALYAGLVVLLLLVLAIPISRLRRSRGVGLGDGGDRELARAIRVHANLLEWGLPAIVLLLIADLTRAPALLLHGCGLVLVAGRALHAFGLSRSSGYSLGRFVGTALTWAVLLALAGWNLWAFVRIALR
jgi:uncharacterized membrane protein YecN with MAPEG domain